jgi:hypothetical protein
MLGPLAQLANLRRLDNSEFEDAARVILQKRSTRISRNNQSSSALIQGLPASQTVVESSTDSATQAPEAPVPLPPDED